MTAVDLSKQQAVDADRKAIQQINFTANLDRAGNTRESFSFLKKLKKLKSSIKNEIEVVLRLSSKMVGNCGDETIFPHKLLSTNRQVANLHKAFANYL